MLRDCLAVLEANRHWRAVVPCEPQLGPRGLYPTLSTRESGHAVRDMMNLLAYADGRSDLLVASIAQTLAAASLLEDVSPELADAGA